MYIHTHRMNNGMYQYTLSRMVWHDVKLFLRGSMSDKLVEDEEDEKWCVVCEIFYF